MTTQRRHTPLAHVHVEPAHCTVGQRLHVLGRVPFLQGLDAAALAEVNRAFQAEHYRPGATVYAEGDALRGLHVVAVGRVALVRHTAAGQDVLLEILAPGDFCGGLAHEPGHAYAESAEALTPACVLVCPPAPLRALLLAHPAVALRMVELLGERLRAANDAIRRLSAQPAEQRLAAVLLRLARALGEPDAHGLLIQAPLARKHLADMTGTTTETASRILSEFSRRGWIAGGRRWVAIRDEPALAALAEADDEI